MEAVEHKFTHEPGTPMSVEENEIATNGFVVAHRRKVHGGTEVTYAKMTRAMVDGKMKDVALLAGLPPDECISKVDALATEKSVQFGKDGEFVTVLYGTCSGHKYVVLGENGKRKPVSEKKKQK